MSRQDHHASDHPHEHGQPHEHGHPPEHGQPHEHGDQHGHDRGHRKGVAGLLRAVVAPHSHDAAESVDQALTSSDSGMRCLVVSLALLAATAVVEMVIVIFSGSTLPGRSSWR